MTNIPELSDHFARREPSDIRVAQIIFGKRQNKIRAINVAIGNVSLPMHPAMTARMHSLSGSQSPFAGGVVQYTTTKGTAEANQAILNIIASSGLPVDGLHTHMTDGGSAAMELVLLGTCAFDRPRPLMLLEPAYTNYRSLCERLRLPSVAVKRTLEEDGRFTLPDMDAISRSIAASNPGALVIIPYDNPSGQFLDRATLCQLAALCVKHNIWIVSDEAYRELYYQGSSASSIWSLSEQDVPGITGRRISIESASKVWNACGLRIGSIVSDSADFIEKSVAEATATLCANAIGQHIFAALAHEDHKALQSWYGKQREYYVGMLSTLCEDMQRLLPGVIVSRPEASLYTVVDVKKIAPADFNSLDFVMFCAREGRVRIGTEDCTLLVAPMAGFYTPDEHGQNPGRTQMRIACVENREGMKLVPELFAQLFAQYISQ